jgi:glucose-1-phosphate thymidylyltransferase
MMKAIIPVAGVGTRLRPHTHTAPKVLLQVAGKPILGHILDQLINLGIKDITFIVGYLGQMVEEYIETCYPMIEAHFVEQEVRQGLGHAIWLTRDLHTGDEPILIILGDTVFQADLCGALSNKVTQIGVREVDDPRSFGIVELAPDGYVAHLEEKPEHPKTNLAIVGIYVIHNPKRLFASLEEIIGADRRTRGEFQLTDALERMLEAGEKMKTFSIDEWLDCGKPETLLETNRILLERKVGKIPNHYATDFPDSIILPPVSISPGAKIERSIVGPFVSVSENAEVRHSIVANTIISKGAVAENIILESSIVSDNAYVRGHRTRLNVGDSSEIRFD